MSTPTSPRHAPPQADRNPFDSLADGQVLHYRSVQVQLPDGSQFYLLAEELALAAAKLVAIPGIPPSRHLQQQIVPLIVETPNTLLDIARRLSWSDMMAIASRAFWRTPAPLLAPRLKEARLSLHTLRG